MATTVKKELKDYLHLYLGCECQVSQSDYYDGGTGKLVRIDIEDVDDTVVVSDNTIYNRTKYCVEAAMSDVKPILRHLSDMTEEEAIECGNLDYDFSGEPDLNKWTWKDFDTLNSSNQFIYLLSKRFDLFELIECGLAIDAKTLK